LEKKWLEGSTGLKNDPQGRQVFPLAGTPLENSWLRSWLELSHDRLIIDSNIPTKIKKK
jgi:hypothetical protein